MKVLYWTELFRPDIGGAEISSEHLLNGLQENGHSCCVIACHGKNQLPDQTNFRGIPVHRFWFHRLLLKKDLKSIRDAAHRIDTILREFEPDLIHLRTSQPSLFFLQQSREARKLPWLATICEPPTESLTPSSLLGQVFSRTRRIVSVSAATQKSLLTRLPDLGDRSHVIHNGLPLPTETPSTLSFQPPRILYFGRLTQDKGVDLAIYALAEIRKVHTNIEMTITGGGPEKESLTQQVSRLGLEDSVHFTGWINPQEIPALINRHDLVVVPSRWEEPFGLVALQAAQMGRPAIAARIGGLAEIIDDGTTGLLFEPDKLDDLVEKLHTLLSRPERAQDMGKAARERASEKFSMSRVIREYEETYHKLISNP